MNKYLQFFYPKTALFSEYTDKGKYLLTWRLSAIFTCVFLFLSGSLFWLHTITTYIYLLTFILGLSGFIYLQKTTKYQHLYWLYAIGGTSMLNTAIFLDLNTIHYPELIWAISIMIFSFIGLGRKAGIFFLVSNTILYTTHVFLISQLDEPLRKPDSVELTSLLVEMMLAMFMTGYLIRQFIHFQHYAEKQAEKLNEELGEQNRMIVRKNEENELLVKEIHHRVKNNLQIIISLLRMQGEEIQSKEAKQHFSEAISRVMSMSMIHEKLYRERNLSTINLERYLTDLTTELMHSFGDCSSKCRCDCRSEVQNMGLKTIVPFGLLINELVTNSLKHAFECNEPGLITIRLTETPDNRLILFYADNGKWKDERESNHSFGSELITLLTHQLDGTVERKGGVYSFELSNAGHGAET